MVDSRLHSCTLVLFPKHFAIPLQLHCSRRQHVVASCCWLLGKNILPSWPDWQKIQPLFGDRLFVSVVFVQSEVRVRFSPVSPCVTSMSLPTSCVCNKAKFWILCITAQGLYALVCQTPGWNYSMLTVLIMGDSLHHLEAWVFVLNYRFWWLYSLTMRLLIMNLAIRRNATQELEEQVWLNTERSGICSGCFTRYHLHTFEMF